MSATGAVRVLVTGFGPFLDVAINPSFEIVYNLPSALPDGTQIIAHPEPMKAVYRSLLETTPKLIKQHVPDIALNIGLAVERTWFGVEQSAGRDGYHEVLDEEHKVISKNDSKLLWPKKSPERFETSFDINKVIDLWRQNLKIRVKGGKKAQSETGAETADVRLSDDVGSYICGLQYYTSLTELGKRGNQRMAVFLHVPPLLTPADIKRGEEVVLALIKALVQQYRDQQV